MATRSYSPDAYEPESGNAMRLSENEFADLVSEALDVIPEPLVAYMREVAVDVQPIPDARTCKEAGISDPRTLLGLYRGTPLTRRSVEHSGRLPDRIIIYQHNIERRCHTRRQIIRQIRKTVFHEVGHHFGLSEDDLQDLGYQ